MQVGQSYKGILLPEHLEDFDTSPVDIERVEVIYEDDVFLCQFTYHVGYPDRPFIHFKTSKWSLSIFKRLKKKFNEALDKIKNDGEVSCILAVGNVKFSKMFGFNHMLTYNNVDYYILELV